MSDFKTIQNKPINDLKGIKFNLSLSRLIRDKPGLVGCNIVGTQQSGKSSYALLVLYELYKGNVDEVFKHIVFSVKDLTELLTGAIQNHERMICVLWDDASVSGSAGMYNVNRRMVQYLSAMGDTMGLATKSILLTSPSADLIKAFRNYNFYKVHINTGRFRYDRVAKGYEFGTSPYSQKWIKTAFEDKFDLRTPFYDRYYELRERLSVSTLKDMDTFLNTSDEQQEREVIRKPTKAEKAIELHRDWQAGVFNESDSEVTYKSLCKAHKIPYGYAKKVVSNATC